MPILHDPDRSFPRVNKSVEPVREDVIMRKPSEESIRTEDCEGPVLDIPDQAKDVVDLGDGMDRKEGGVCTSDRRELMERIKRGESPTWVPSQTLQKIVRDEEKRSLSPPARFSSHEQHSLLPAAEVEDVNNQQATEVSEDLSSPTDIQRPRSALHTGDFKEDREKPRLSCCSESQDHRLSDSALSAPFGTLGQDPWDVSCSNSQNRYSVTQSSSGSQASQWADQSYSRSRAPSLGSYSSSFVLKAPTTPLVQQSNNTDLDFSPRDFSTSPTKESRRHTLPPRPSHTLQSSSSAHSSLQQALHHVPYRRDVSLPYQTHRARSSLTRIGALQAPQSPQRPALIGSRRTSFSSETSPLHNASMVGSYEESILRGWMSTAPSRPLDFTAQIGVLGKGNCKPKCPAHVTVSFPAVFYSWSGGNGRVRSNIDDEPSPYVGHIDLNNLQPNPKAALGGRRRRSNSPDIDFGKPSLNSGDGFDSIHDHVTGDAKRRRKRRRTSPGPRAPPGGSYRIPQEGQLQIIIKNPNKTAVKLFLLPYNLTAMEPGTKTFIRQRCYSTDPIIDSLPSATPSSEPTLSTNVNSMFRKKPALRYLIHVNICCPAKGRFYLYQQIRVVFANRVPDNKEQLQTEIHWPQPRYSSYNPNSLISRSSSNAVAKFQAEKAARRRSAGPGMGTIGVGECRPPTFANGFGVPFKFGSSPPPVPDIPSSLDTAQRKLQSGDTYTDKPFPEQRAFQHSGNGSDSPFTFSSATSPTPAIPFNLPILRTRPQVESTAHIDDDVMDLDQLSRPTTSSGVQSPCSDKTNAFKSIMSSSYKSSSSHSSDGYGKLSKGDYARSVTPEPGKGLLARKLKGL